MLRPETRQAIQGFWQAVRAGGPIRALFLDAQQLVEEDMMEQMYTCNKCGHEGPRADFTGSMNQVTKRCYRCRAKLYKNPDLHQTPRAENGNAFIRAQSEPGPAQPGQVTQALIQLTTPPIFPTNPNLWP